jgi:hypothetical protein
LDPGQTIEPIVCRSVDLDDQHLPLDQIDEGQEQLAVQSALVEIARRPVRRGHDLDALLEQPPEQPREDHCVGRVRHLHLVEAEELGSGRDLLRHGLDWIALFFLPSLSQSCVRLEHEFVEVDAALRMHVDMLEGEIHQHRLSAPYAAPQIRPRRSLLPRTEDAREQAGAILQTIRKAVEGCDGTFLCGIGPQFVRGNQGVVGGPYGSAHRDEGPLGRFTFLSVPLKL